jgi:selenophosphate synthase
MGMASPEQLQEINAAMTKLNRDSSRLAIEHGARAMTDITGFGLIGHALEMARASNVMIEFSYSQIPLFSGVAELAKKGYITGCGRKSNPSLPGLTLDATRRAWPWPTPAGLTSRPAPAPSYQQCA